jgi:dTDP-4-amino-4,6-dideoxygalactose transaminase
MRNKFLVFGSPKIGDDEINEVVDSLQSGWLGTGPKVARFEGDFAAYKGVNVSHVAAVNSCTAALHLSLLAAGVGKGDEVITTPMTFCATINAIIHAGATPVLADIDPISMNIDPDCIEDVITPRTRAVLPVHFAGRPCDMDAIMNIAGRHDLKVIEDCAHAIETEYKGRKIGTIGDFGCFSFYVTKNIVTGEGGMVIAREKEDAEKIKVLALHGMSKDAWKRFSDLGYKHYKVVDCGFKYNMMDLQAAIGIHQLKHISDYWLRRQQIWNRYKIEFNDLNLSLPANPEPDTLHAYHLFPVLIDKETSGISRDEFLDFMTANNIGVGVHYTSIPEHPFYQDSFGWQSSDYPNAAKIGSHTASIPLSPALTETDISDVIGTVVSALQQK